MTSTRMPTPLDLPETSLQPFAVDRLSSARLIARHPSAGYPTMSDDDLVRTFGYMIRSSHDCSTAFLPDSSATMLAERYGGEGIGTHAGGARCGLIGAAQVKGVGANCLASQDAELDYSHGGASLFESLMEMAWAMIFQRALPYGAVQLHCVLSTDTKCWWVINRWGESLLRDRYGSDVYLPRGLMIREPALRPAHFERVMLLPHYATQDSVAKDVVRVKTAVAVLPRILFTLANQYTHSNVTFDIDDALSEIAKRFARQSAAAKAKRLLHGNISPSNICIDGRWIDFGSVISLPGWGDVGGYGSFWNDETRYYSILSNLRFNLWKYGAPPRVGITAERLHLIYQSEHDFELSWRLTGMSGLPVAIAKRLADTPSGRRFASAFLRLTREGHHEPFEGHPGIDDDFGTFDLCGILGEFAWRGAIPSVPDQEQQGRLRPLLEAWRTLIEDAADIQGYEWLLSNKGAKLLALNASRLSIGRRYFHRPSMVASCERMVIDNRDPSALRKLAEQWLAEVDFLAEIIFADTDGLKPLLWADRQCRLSYYPRGDVFNLSIGGEDYSIAWAEVRSAHPSVVASVTSLWGNRIIEVLDET